MEERMDGREAELGLGAPERGQAFCAMIEDGLPAEANLRMELTLVLPGEKGQPLRAGLRVGEGKWYVVREIPQLLTAWKTRTALPFQSRFVYEPEWMHFPEKEERVLKLLDRVVSVRQEGGRLPGAAGTRLMALSGSSVPNTFLAMDLL